MAIIFNHQKFAPVSRRSMCELTVLDDSDPDIVYDEHGVCLVARQAQHRLATEYFGDSDGKSRLAAIVERIKAEGRGKEYDCIIGVSGGVDSTYIAWMIKEYGLRALAVHLDNGWDTELAQANIERTVTKLGIDLFTYVVDWEEIKDLQRALFKASLIDIEMVTDHAINAVLFGQAAKRNIGYIIPGSNITTESLMPSYYAYDQRDLRNLLAVHRRFGIRRLKSYPMLSAKKMLYYILAKRIKFIPFLNYVPFNKNEALALLKNELGYVPYPRKHGESRFTRFFQEYYLPTKFNIDKRKAHFSALILSGQMTRDEALAELNKPLFQPEELEEELDYVTSKLGFTRQEFAEIIRLPAKRHTDYPNLAWLFDPSSSALQLVKRFAKGEIGK